MKVNYPPLVIEGVFGSFKFCPSSLLFANYEFNENIKDVLELPKEIYKWNISPYYLNNIKDEIEILLIFFFIGFIL